MDVVVSNCVLNLVEPNSKRQLFDEIFRVLRKGGRAVISDIVSDEEVPKRLQNDPALWSGCISGALTEEGFLRAFSEAGFYGIQILKRDSRRWQTVDGIEFRSLTVEAFKGKQGPCFERNQAVISSAAPRGQGRVAAARWYRIPRSRFLLNQILIGRTRAARACVVGPTNSLRLVICWREQSGL